MQKGFLSIVRDFYASNTRDVRILIASTMFWAVTFPVGPKLLGGIIEGVKTYAEQPEQSIYPAIFAAMGLVLVQVLRNCNYSLINRHYARSLANTQSQIMQMYFASLCARPYAYFQKTDSGTLSGKANNLLASLDPVLMSFYVVLLPQVIAISLSGLAMIYVSPIMAVLFCSWAFCIIFMTYRSSKRSKSKTGAYAESSSKMTGRLTDTLSNIDTVILNSAAEHEQHLMHKAANNMRDSYIDMRFLLERDRLIQGGITDTYLVLAIITLFIGYYSGDVSVGDFVFVFTLTFNISGIFFMLGSTIAEFHKNMGKVREGYSEILESSECKKQAQTETNALTLVNGNIDFDKVTFAYKGSQNILNNFTLHVKQGEKLGIVGASGSGKSTLLKLLLRLFDIEHGRIRIGDKEIHAASRASLRALISFVPQNISLFNRTVRENITYGCGNASDEAIYEAARLANCLDFINSLPEKFETVVGEKGGQLSGGQRQRVAIAQAILKNAPILLLDEATSALDSETEAKIQASIDTLIADKTALIVAHRLSTLKKMDRIIVIDKGKIVEQGTHETLLAENGVYAELWRHQSGDARLS